jgi:hypothetical protein
MNNLLAIIIIVAATCILTTGALNLGNSTAGAGMVALNEKYRDRCVSLGGGKRGAILGIGAKTIKIAVVDDKGREQIVNIKRLPLDKFIVPCRKK